MMMVNHQKYYSHDDNFEEDEDDADDDGDDDRQRKVEANWYGGKSHDFLLYTDRWETAFSQLDMAWNEWKGLNITRWQILS